MNGDRSRRGLLEKEKLPLRHKWRLIDAVDFQESHETKHSDAVSPLQTKLLDTLAELNEAERSAVVPPVRRARRFVVAAQVDTAAPSDTVIDSQEPASQKPTPKKKNGNWSTADLEKAIEAIEGGAKIATAARAVNIPVSTVREHLFGKSKGRKRGPAAILSPEEEQELKIFLLEMANKGHPLTPTELKLKVAQLTQTRRTPFKNGIPGKGWLKWWKKRHPDLAIQSPQGLVRTRNLGSDVDERSGNPEQIAAAS